MYKVMTRIKGSDPITYAVHTRREAIQLAQHNGYGEMAVSSSVYDAKGTMIAKYAWNGSPGPRSRWVKCYTGPESRTGSGDPSANCPACGHNNDPMGYLGSVAHYRCRHCGADYSRWS